MARSSTLVVYFSVRVCAWIACVPRIGNAGGACCVCSLLVDTNCRGQAVGEHGIRNANPVPGLRQQLRFVVMHYLESSPGGTGTCWPRDDHHNLSLMRVWFKEPLGSSSNGLG